MKILVTGGAGFIGSHIVDSILFNGDDVVVVDNFSTGFVDNLKPDVHVYKADVRDAQAINTIFKREKPDAVCHQAAQISVSQSMRLPRFDADNNIMGLLSVLDAAVHHDCPRVVFASSGGVLYGDVSTPAIEDTAPQPISPYGVAKWACERYLSIYAAKHAITAVALRYSNVYGPRQNPHGEAGVVAIFCQQFLKQQPAHIHGDGSCVRDYVYGPDVAEANYKALTKKMPEKFVSINIGTGVGTDVKTLEKTLRLEMSDCMSKKAFMQKNSSNAEQNFSGMLPKPEYGPERLGDLKSSIVDNTRANKLLDIETYTELRDGLTETAAWFVENKD